MVLVLLANTLWTFVALSAYTRWFSDASQPGAPGLRALARNGVFVGLSTSVLSLVILLVVGWTVRRRGQSIVGGLRLAWAGPFSWTVVVLLGLCLAVSEDLVAVSVSYPVVPLALRPLLQTPTALLVFGLSACVFAPIAEEVFFRGLLYPALAHRLGVALAIATTAFVFGLSHAATYGVDLFPILMTIISGYALTLLRAFTGSTATSIVMHITLNLYATIEAAIFMATRRM